MKKRRVGIQVDAPLPFEEMVRVVKEADESGLEIVWFHEGQDYDSISFLSAVAARTERIRLGTAVASVYTRLPGLMAMGAATAAHVSAGRFVLGIGSSHRRLVEGIHKTPLIRPLARMRDYATIIRAGLEGQAVTYSGKAVAVENLNIRVPGQRFRVPIYFGCIGLQMARLAGQVADGVILHLATPEYVGRVRQAIKEGAAAARRDPGDIDVACFIMCSLGNRTAARENMIEAVAFYGQLERYRNHLRDLGFEGEARGLMAAWDAKDSAAASRYVTDEMLNQLPAGAGPESTLEKLEQFSEAGVDLPILYPFPSRNGQGIGEYTASLYAALRLAWAGGRT